MSGLLIRERPATELAVATRILAHLGILAPEGRLALAVGTDLVYLAARGTSPATMTPYDVCAVLRRDGSVLAGTAPDDVARYLGALEAAAGATAVALTADGRVAAAPDLRALVEGSSGAAWPEAEASARAAGALVGAYPFAGP